MLRSEIAPWLVLALAPALAGCDRAAATNERPEAAPQEAKRVVIVKPARQSIARVVTQPATVLALNEATLYAQVAGYLAEIRVDKGDLVEKDEVLATIAVPELEAEKRQVAASKAQAEAERVQAIVECERAESSRLAAEAGLKRGQADLDLQKQLYDRAKDLRSDGVVSIQELEIAEGRYKEAQASLTLEDAKLKEAAAAKRAAESQIEVAKAKVDTATALMEKIEARLAYAKIRAPFKGVVTRRFVDPGAMIQQATSSSNASPVVTVVEIDRVRVDFQLPEAEVAHVATGQKVALKVDAYPERTFSGTVTRDAGALDPASRTMLVEAEYANEDRALRPGMFGEASLELERRANALTLPAEALRSHEGRRSVFVVENGVAHRRPVTAGLDNGPVVEIVKGLGDAESVVLGGGRLTDGAPVTALERKPEAISGSEEKGE